MPMVNMQFITAFICGTFLRSIMLPKALFKQNISFCIYKSLSYPPHPQHYWSPCGAKSSLWSKESREPCPTVLFLSSPLLSDGTQLIAEATENEPFRRWMSKMVMLYTLEDALVCLAGQFLVLGLPIVTSPASEKATTFPLCWVSAFLLPSVTSAAAYSVQVDYPWSWGAELSRWEYSQRCKPWAQVLRLQVKSLLYHSLFPPQVLICSETQFPFPWNGYSNTCSITLVRLLEG